MDGASKNEVGRWSFWVDRGGTFTDIVGENPRGEIVTSKLLSENPERYADAALQGIRELMGLAAGVPIPGECIHEVKMGTTVGTNALLERRGERVALLVTRGFADGLRIAYQNRPKLFALEILLPELLYSEVIEVDERVGADGTVIVPLDPEPARKALASAFARGIRSVAIVCLHGYRFPEHEQRLAEIAGEIGFGQISASHAVSPLIKFVSRGDTTVVDAYLSPVLKRYVGKVAEELAGVRLLFMKSDGGLTAASFFAGKDSILSGPAGGVVGMVRTAEAAGFSRIIGFDMGGTSTDVSHYSGEFERSFETEVAGVRMRTPMLSIHTVAAGGGSILHFDGSRCRVGPDSAGANPGPACYRRGGPLTVTDCNVVCGKILPGYFPAIFGSTGDQPLDAESVHDAFATLAREVAAATGEEKTVQEVADGFLAIAVANMANAIKAISTRRGHDLGPYALACFGGAGGQHACLVAEALGMETIFLHARAGVLSAYGMGLAERSSMGEEAVSETLSPFLAPMLARQVEALKSRTVQGLAEQGVALGQVMVSAKAQLRYQGSDACLLVCYGPHETMVAEFAETHRRRFGFIAQEKALIVDSLVVEARERRGAVFSPDGQECPPCELPARAFLETCRFFSQGSWQVAPVLAREAMLPGNRFTGPAIIIEPHSTVVVEPGWQAEVLAGGSLVLRRAGKGGKDQDEGNTAVDPVRLEIMNSLFMAIAEQMGMVLANTALSVNIKERLDFSCAIFDASGNLVANAPHVPVHLGSMGEAVQALITERASALSPGDVYLSNAPYGGGTHLPDLTVISPVFGEGEILFYVASRGHHADIGGKSPGSMPADSTTVAEEGVLFANFRLVAEGRFAEAEVLRHLRSGPYPARNPGQNLADLAAQVAANEKGAQELARMVSEHGLPVVQAYMQHVQDNAEEAVRRLLSRLQDGKAEYLMDNGAKIRVRIRVDRKQRTACIDFSGTSPQCPSNYNAPLAVCKAAVLYVFRCLLAEDIPLNAGCLKPLSLIVPEGCLLNPVYPAAVVAGNVETSQCVTDALFSALGAVACSQGTMNNLTFGDDIWQYYETIGGGAGAGPDFAGASGVQTHMTNSRLTDPEILEFRFPVLLESFALRRGSGGRGKFKGGDGLVRKLRFLKPMRAAILANNRLHAPLGLAGGGNALPGRNRVLRADGSEEELPFAGQADLASGDALLIETPGGGGYGLEEEGR